MKNAEVVKLLYKNATSTGHTCGICSHIAKQKKEAVYRNLNCQPISSIFVHKDAADTYERVMHFHNRKEHEDGGAMQARFLVL
ncbi:hypothetical protein GQ600_2757 [Phytophthora cactorum]|nr:hypothetical protein GQ600_2757 [Phytophthora cactorum]